jgi:hypothetical protein
MKQCKPCITIRDIAKIIYLNIKFTYENIKTDIKSYRNINATVCELDKPTATPFWSAEYKAIQKIRKEAQDNSDIGSH